MQTALLLSPLARGAFFDETVAVAQAELRAVTGIEGAEYRSMGGLELLVFEATPEHLRALTRLSTTQAILAIDGENLRPQDVRDGLLLPRDLVFANKYPGKTHELATQLALNVGIAHCSKAPRNLLDPMAGQGTTLLWALRYGLDSRGIELDANALPALHRHLKRQSKLHRLSHQHDSGFVGKKNKECEGQFERFRFGAHSLQLIRGDSRTADRWVSKQRFDLVVTDLPYGIRFKGKNTRSVLNTLEDCAAVWADRVNSGGALVLAHNTYQTKTDALRQLFTPHGLEPSAFSAPHRMSESIIRDFAVFTKKA